jgi:hypothetical protein
MSEEEKKPRFKRGLRTFEGEHKFKMQYCDMLEDHMAKGLSFEAFAGVIGVGPVTLYRWAKRYEEFKDAKEKGFAKSRLFWEKLGVAAAAGKVKDFNATAYVFNMKNRFGWRDKVDVSVDGQIEHEHNHTHTIETKALIEELSLVLQNPTAERLPILEVQPIHSEGSPETSLQQLALAHRN